MSSRLSRSLAPSNYTQVRYYVRILRWMWPVRAIRNGADPHAGISPDVCTDGIQTPSIATLKGYPTDDALVGCYVLGKTLGRSADLKVKNETLFYTSAADLAYME
ncbi:hypothetical protein EVAR_27171_1 [Eumeta japonica]|uniref:Uncharacterized protein n=1 Tax=Eumeta variegata TaxID=151549 RepID=A0A4C1W0B8_EUMVA|nr:hypothetical protein EVAR_27171_1 [Eumeta japonica]